MSSLIVDHSHNLPLVDQRTSCPSKVYQVSWFVTSQNTWYVRWLVPSLITWDQVMWWFSMCPLFLRIMWWSYYGVHLWDFWLRTLRTWCHGLCPWHTKGQKWDKQLLWMCHNLLEKEYNYILMNKRCVYINKTNKRWKEAHMGLVQTEQHMMHTHPH